MGAHALPREFSGDRQGYIELIINEILPEAAELAEYCDVFCEKSAFDPSETESILEAAKKHGFKLKIHADEIHNLGGAELAARLGCVSAEHLIKISEDGIAAIAASETIAVLLPCTSFYLNESFAPAKKIINAGGAVAVATDFNPGSTPNLNIQLALSMSCYKYSLSPAEALTAVTLNAAAAIDRAASVGSVELGKQGDLVVWDAPSLDYLLYRYGGNMAKTVIKKGNIEHQKQ
jgi:imidazolonepropionase